MRWERWDAMSEKRRQVFRAALLFAAIALGSAASTASAQVESEDQGRCGWVSGALMFGSFNSGGSTALTCAKYGLQDGNTDWSVYGWDDRADYFDCQGNTHNCCLYSEHSCYGTALWMKKGTALYWKYDIVSSNFWTRAPDIRGCPIGC
jgi:hypothetical protein